MGIKVQTMDNSTGTWCTEMVDNWLRLVGEHGWSIELHYEDGKFNLRSADGLLHLQPRSANEVNVDIELR